MQVKNIHPIEFLERRGGVFSVIKGAVSLLCLYFLYSQFTAKKVDFSFDTLPDSFFKIALFQVILMGGNWSLEILRWKTSFQASEKISTKTAATDVLGGLAMNWVIPGTAGDFITRIASKQDRYKATSALLLNRMIMLALTSALGIFGVAHFADLNFEFRYELLLYILSGSVLFFLYRKYLGKFFAYFKETNGKTYWSIGLLSILRYVVFIVQYLILLKLFLPQLNPVLLLAGIGWIFAARSLVPSFLGGAGVREASAFLFFQGLVPDLSLVIIPVFFLWLLNTVFPSIVGLILIWKLRLKIAE